MVTIADEAYNTGGFPNFHTVTQYRRVMVFSQHGEAVYVQRLLKTGDYSGLLHVTSRERLSNFRAGVEVNGLVRELAQ